MTREEFMDMVYSELHSDGDNYRANRIIDAADEYVETEKESNWIPCSERLPEIGQKVLVSTKRTVFTQVFKGVYSEPNVWHWEHNSIKEIAAWMPLPEPYVKEQEHGICNME